MKICEIMAGDEEGGLENHFIDLCNGLSATHEVHVIAHQRYADRFSPQLNFHPLDLSKGRNNPLLWWQLLRRVRQIGPDVLHVHASKGAALVSRIQRWIQCPCVATIHSLKRKTAMFEGFDQLIAVSKGVAAPINNPRLQVIYNGRDLNDEVSVEAARSDKAVLLCVGRLEEVKGVDILLQAFARVENPDAELWIAGDGSLRKPLEQLAGELNVSERVRFLGMRDDVQMLMKQASAVVIPSRREGFPLVLVEALLLGCPVISTRVPGAVEILPEPLLADTENSDQLAAIVNNMLGNQGLLQALMEPVFSYAQDNLTFQAQLAQTENLLMQVAEGTH